MQVAMNIVRSAATVSFYTLLSRILGFVRDLLIATTLGAGPLADAFFTAFRLPNLFRRLFAEGAFNSAFAPIFAQKLEQDGPESARNFAQEAFSIVLLVTIFLTAFAQLIMPGLIVILAPGFLENPVQFEQTTQMARLAFPYLGLMTLTALAGGVLNGIGRFWAAAAAPILLNIIMITSLLAFANLGKSPGHVLAAAVTVSGLAQLILVTFAAKKAGYELRLKWPRLTYSVKRLFKLMAPGVLAASATQINIVVGSQLASLLAAGAISHLYYADRLYQLPLGVIGVAIGVALLPQISRETRAGNDVSARATLNRAQELSLWLTLPAASTAISIPETLVSALFEHGAFDRADARATALALVAYAAGLPAFVLTKTLVPAFFAREDTKTPAKVAALSVVVNIALGLILMWPLGHVGLALATTFSSWLQTIFLSRHLMQRGWFTPNKQMLRRIIGMVAASAVMATALHFAGPLVLEYTGITRLITAIGLCLAGALFYLILTHLIGSARIDVAIAEFRGQTSKS